MSKKRIAVSGPGIEFNVRGDRIAKILAAMDKFDSESKGYSYERQTLYSALLVRSIIEIASSVARHEVAAAASARSLRNLRKTILEEAKK